MNTSLLIAVAAVSACVVLVDARRHDVPQSVLWALGVFLCWIGVLPAYILFRIGGRSGATRSVQPTR